MTIFVFYAGPQIPDIEYFEVYGGLQAPGGIRRPCTSFKGGRVLPKSVFTRQLWVLSNRPSRPPTKRVEAAQPFSAKVLFPPGRVGRCCVFL